MHLKGLFTDGCCRVVLLFHLVRVSSSAPLQVLNAPSCWVVACSLYLPNQLIQALALRQQPKLPNNPPPQIQIIHQHPSLNIPLLSRLREIRRG